MKIPLIFKDAAYGAKKGGGTVTHPDELLDGAIGLFVLNENGLPVLLTAANAGTSASAGLLSDTQSFFIARGIKDGCILSDEIFRDGAKLESAEFAEVSSATASITPAVKIGSQVGDVGHVTITDVSSSDNRDYRSRIYDYQLTTPNPTKAVMMAAIVDAINADAEGKYEATASGTDETNFAVQVYLKDGNEGVTFDVSASGALASSIVNRDNGTSLGSGTGDKVALIEETYAAYLGRTDYLNAWNQPDFKQTDSSVNYDQYNLSHVFKLERAGDPHGGYKRGKYVYLAFPDKANAASDGQSVFETLIKALVNPSTSAIAVETGEDVTEGV